MSQMVSENLTDYPVIVNIPVAWGEMDAFGHVNNIVYFRYFETARIHYFEKINFIDYMQETGIGPILLETACQYKKPIQYPEELKVGTRVSKIGNSSLSMDYLIVGKTTGLAATGIAIGVAYDYKKGKTTRIPDIVREAIIQLEGKDDL